MKFLRKLFGRDQEDEGEDAPIQLDQELRSRQLLRLEKALDAAGQRDAGLRVAGQPRLAGPGQRVQPAGRRGDDRCAEARSPARACLTWCSRSGRSSPVRRRPEWSIWCRCRTRSWRPPRSSASCRPSSAADQAHRRRYDRPALPLVRGAVASYGVPDGGRRQCEDPTRTRHVGRGGAVGRPQPADQAECADPRRAAGPGRRRPGGAVQLRLRDQRADHGQGRGHRRG